MRVYKDCLKAHHVRIEPGVNGIGIKLWRNLGFEQIFPQTKAKTPMKLYEVLNVNIFFMGEPTSAAFEEMRQ